MWGHAVVCQQNGLSRDLVAGGSLFGSGFISSSVRSYMKVGGIEDAMSHVFIDSVSTNSVSKLFIDRRVSQSAFRMTATATGLSFVNKRRIKKLEMAKTG